MSERVQRTAVARRDAARERAKNARRRAQRNRDRGENFMARRHDAAADRQAAAAERAEDLRRADVRVEGEQLGESPAATG